MTKGMTPFEPTEKDRSDVEKLAGYGFLHEQICEFVINPRTNKPITPKTLRKFFRRELDVGKLRATETVIDTLFMHIKGKPAVYDAEGRKIRDAIAPVYQAAMFWLKCQMDWREVSIHEVSGKNGEPIPIVITQNQSNY